MSWVRTSLAYIEQVAKTPVPRPRDIERLERDIERVEKTPVSRPQRAECHLAHLVKEVRPVSLAFAG
eukprot:3129683-Amphidinium_carterae.3